MMSQAIFKHEFTGEFWVKKIIKILSATQLSKFCCFFTLQQGTIMIAIVELCLIILLLYMVDFKRIGTLILTCLAAEKTKVINGIESLTSFCLFLLLLGATHAQDIVDLVTSDLRQLEENNMLEVEDSATALLNNEKKMLLGQHLAFIIMFVVWAGLLLAIINFISCSFLLYGALRNFPNLLLPWTSTVLFSLISGFFFIVLLPFVPLQECKFRVFVIIVSFYALELYAWLTVFSYYQELKTSELLNFDGITRNATLQAGKTAFLSYEIQY